MTCYDLTVVGLGLAGIALLDAVATQRPDWHLQGLDGGALAGEASSAPGALLNPLPGRSLAPRPVYQAAHAHAGQWLQRWQQRTGGAWLHTDTLLRPLWDNDPVSERLHRSWQRQSQGYGDHLEVTPLTAADLQARYPGFVDAQGAMALSPVYGVAMHAMLRDIAAHLASPTVTLQPQRRVASLLQDADGWRVETTNGTVHTRRVALCVGAQLGDWFPALPLQWMGGELVVWKAPAHVPWPCAFRQKGHLVPMPQGHWTGGSTYRDLGDAPHPTRGQGSSYLRTWQTSLTERDAAAAAHELTEGIARFFPAIREAEVAQVWRGVRAIVRHDRQPLVGSLPRFPHLTLCGALASKGLLLGPALASDLADHICHHTPVPAWADAQRLTAWDSPRIQTHA